MSNVRPAAVAGYFYPADRNQLASDIRMLLDKTTVKPGSACPKALIVPHAGYIYSGQTAAHAYRLLEPWAQTISRVVLLGPSHRTFLRGLALPSADFFATPLGDIPIDTETCQRLAALPQVHVIPTSHISEHSLEVQLPFLQTVLKTFSLVPMAIGLASPQEIADVLDLCRGGQETLIVVSSDLSHYQAYEQARIHDTNTLKHILSNDGQISDDDACGAAPIRGLLYLARDLGLKAELLDYRNSGDTAGDKDRVVGYAAIAFSEAT
ncbi:hypothetical protein SAMN05660284_00876 [Formivibrio citricus]|uniref:MEMO1 family protein SAMN05660284_00876 n=1 Tax=Formivibrio citricus TaxID=83765 RepID=A0A1I4X7U5_9NEIS|nr:AmmeMemoRadiSam system protein B [Formivibrio citricus]SFN21752.1 hypothetical protein SAMN05660284_00876 [Formivibrio citricus]